MPEFIYWGLVIKQAPFPVYVQWRTHNDKVNDFIHYIAENMIEYYQQFFIDHETQYQRFLQFNKNNPVENDKF